MVGVDGIGDPTVAHVDTDVPTSPPPTNYHRTHKRTPQQMVHGFLPFYDRDFKRLCLKILRKPLRFPGIGWVRAPPPARHHHVFIP